MFRTVKDFEKSFKYESDCTLKILRALTDASLQQRVAPEGRTLGRLAWHLAQSQVDMMNKAGLAVDGPDWEAPVPRTADLIVSAIAPQGHVKVFSGLDGQQLPGLIGSFFAFENFLGTVNVGAGDVNGDGFDDVLVAAQGTNGHVKAFSGRDGSLLSSFFAYQGFLGAVSVASADLARPGE